MPTTKQEDAPIRTRIETLAEALRAKDVDALMAHYAPDMTVFDVRPPLQGKGRDAYRKNFEAWFASVSGPIDYEISDLQIAASGDVAFCRCLGHVRSLRTSGEKADYWVRVTTGLQRMGSQWMVTHEHVSIPFYMETMRAALDLQP